MSHHALRLKSTILNIQEIVKMFQTPVLRKNGGVSVSSSCFLCQRPNMCAVNRRGSDLINIQILLSVEITFDKPAVKTDFKL